MKNLFLLSIALIMMMGGMSCNAQSAKKQESKLISSAKVEVYYFHFTRRCITCNAVEAETKKSIEAMYPTLIKSGKISFKALNLDDKSSKTLAKKCGAEGQSLLVISGAKRIDLTSQGFMYARSNPEKLKTELKNAIDPMIKI
jgi:hypothetical protein